MKFNKIEGGEKMEELAQKIDQISKNMYVMFKNMNEMSKKISEEMNLIMEKLDNLETKVNNLEIKVNNLEIKVNNLETKVNNLEIKVDNLEEQMHELEERLTYKIEKNSEAICAIEIELDRRFSILHEAVILDREKNLERADVIPRLDQRISKNEINILNHEDRVTELEKCNH